MLVGQFGEQARFVNGVCKRFFNIHVLPCRHGVGCNDCMRMVGGCHHHRIGILEHGVIHLAVVVKLLGTGIFLEHMVGI